MIPLWQLDKTVLRDVGGGGGGGSGYSFLWWKRLTEGRGSIHPGGAAHQRKLETSSHVASSGRKRKALDSGITSLSPFYLACENVLLTGEGGSPTSVQLSWKLLKRQMYPHRDPTSGQDRNMTNADSTESDSDVADWRAEAAGMERKALSRETLEGVGSEV